MKLKMTLKEKLAHEFSIEIWDFKSEDRAAILEHPYSLESHANSRYAGFLAGFEAARTLAALLAETEGWDSFHLDPPPALQIAKLGEEDTND